MQTFTKDLIHIDDIVVYLKTTATSGRYKFIGQVTGFTDTQVVIRQLSKADQFVTPEECVDYGKVRVNPSDVVHIIISRTDNHFKDKYGDKECHCNCCNDCK